MTNNLKAERTLTAYEMQVLIGATVSGCNMPPDRVFDLTAAWNRLHSLGLIDRADGLAIATASGEARVISALQYPSTQQPMGEVRVKPLDWTCIAGHDGHFWRAPNPFGGLPLEAQTHEQKVRHESDYRHRILSALIHPNQESGE